ncbi:uncharacterized protein J4E79_009905 [Alternaria viburni]|uniref:uncharacterized protein n=1 Tax=Alternaria viburni TaxID=566460 RepID=UPI0020C24B8F|nr:uncharacterized protein J4E79_009905 [Alternaria viburni]KAI4648833.1 hypothetical protein J4E79_009905 [Alternaria viburni]
MPSLYRALDASVNEIRLLILKPSAHNDAQVEAHLKQVSLNDDPEYEALSYVWGDPNARKELMLDGETFTVPLNSWVALHALRKNDHERVLWIDAICINQQDKNERISQVQMMGYIYSKASSVRVWLGAAREQDEDVIAILKRHASGNGLEELLRHDSYYDTLQDFAEQGLLLDILLKMDNPGTAILIIRRFNQYQAVMNFFKTAWWTRLWVVQEVALGRQVVFQKGDSELDWEILVAAYHNTNAFLGSTYHGCVGEVFQNYRDYLKQFESVALVAQVRELCGVESLRDSSSSSSNIKEAAMKWSSVAHLVRNRNATFDQDRLYALYGLLPPSIAANPEMQPSLMSSVEEIYTEVTYNMIKAAQCLMMFNFSWSSFLGSDWRLHHKQSYGENLRLVREKMYNASMSNPFYLRRLSSNTICLKGVLLDIFAMSDYRKITPDSPLILHDTNQDLIKWFLSETEYFRSGLNREEMVKRILVWDCAPGDQEGALKEMDYSEYKAMYAALGQAYKVGQGDFGRNGPEDGQSRDDIRRTDYMMNCAQGQRLFTTCRGLFGMAPMHAKVGDHVFIISGNTHPVLLRPSKRYADTWRPVGECYMHDMMKGEAFKFWDYLKERMNFGEDIPEIQALKGTEKNPRWNEVEEQPEGPWKWLLIE